MAIDIDFLTFSGSKFLAWRRVYKTARRP